jgi:hypothetical protein
VARIRTIKPGFFESEDVSVLPLRARLTWIGLWTQCDDHGRTKDNARLIKARIWPLDDVTLRDVEDDLITLAAEGRIVRYEVDGKRYLAIVNWHHHQTINRPSPSNIPPPVDNPVDAAVTSTNAAHASLTEDSRNAHARKGRERKGRERKGKEGTRASPPTGRAPESTVTSEPPLKCDQHKHDPSPPPCGRCADARKAREAWQQQRRNGHPSTRSVAEAIASARGEP